MNMSAEELRREYEELKKENFPLSKALDFGAKLGESKEIELHFELVVEDDKRPIRERWHPEDYFRFHRQDGVLYLRSLLVSENKDYATNAAYLMAELLMKGRYDHQAELLSELNNALVSLAESEEPKHRRKALIAIGWVGTEREIPTLKRHLLSDSDYLCRAWSSSSFLQMSGRIPEDILKESSRDVLIYCLEHETDVFVRGVAVETVQAVWDVKLGLRQSAVDERKEKAVNRAVRRALEYLNAEE